MITSTANQRVKRLTNLRKKRKLRDEEGVFLVEGIRMFREVPEDALMEVYVSESFYRKEKKTVDDICAKSRIRPEILTDSVFEHVSDTRTPQGVLCTVRQRSREVPVTEAWSASALRGRKPLILVLDNLQDPGNLGTILRTAEAAGVTGIIMSRECVDIYNPKTIRSTMGSVFRMPFWYVQDITDAIRQMKVAGVQTYAAHLKGKRDYDGPDYREASAFFIGNEGNGLRDEVAELADEYILIPMMGEVESLNAAIAATVLMFEAGRQRRN